MCESCSILAFFALATGNLIGALFAPKDGSAGLLRRLAPLLFGACAIVSPAFLPREWPIVRTCVAFAVAGSFLRLVEIVRRPETFDARQRFVNVLLPFMDARRAEKGTPGFRWVPIAVAAIEFAVALGFFVWVRRIPSAAPYSGLANVERTLIGGISCYFTVDAVGRGVHAIFTSIGVVVEKPHDHPILSTSLSEFWGRRWNRAVGRYLYENVFRPVSVRAGVVWGVLATFVVSGLLHFIPLALVCTLAAATWMGAFFVVHGVLLLVESKLGVARLGPGVGRAFTYAAFAATTPMFVEPMLEALGQ